MAFYRIHFYNKDDTEIPSVHKCRCIWRMAPSDMRLSVGFIQIREIRFSKPILTFQNNNLD